MSNFAATRCSAAAAERAPNAPASEALGKQLQPLKRIMATRRGATQTAAAPDLHQTVMSETFPVLVAAVFCLCFLKECVSLFVFTLFK